MQAIGFAVAGESDVAVPGDDALRKVAPPMAKGVQIEIAGDRTVYLPVYTPVGSRASCAEAATVVPTVR